MVSWSHEKGFFCSVITCKIGTFGSSDAMSLGVNSLECRNLHQANFQEKGLDAQGYVRELSWHQSKPSTKSTS